MNPAQQLMRFAEQIQELRTAILCDATDEAGKLSSIYQCLAIDFLSQAHMHMKLAFHHAEQKEVQT